MLLPVALEGALNKLETNPGSWEFGSQHLSRVRKGGTAQGSKDGSQILVEPVCEIWRGLEVQGVLLFPQSFLEMTCY